MRFEMKRSLGAGAAADPDPRGLPAVVGAIPDEALLKCPFTIRNTDNAPGRLLLAAEGTAADTLVVEVFALDDTGQDRGASMPLGLTQAQKEAREFYRVTGLLTVTVGELLAFAAGAPTVATLLGVAGTFPTTFSGGETLILNIDGIQFTTTFLVGDQSAAEVVVAINAAALTAGVPVPPASVSGTEVLLTGAATGTSGHITVAGGTGAATLGLAGSAVGADVGASTFPGGVLYVRVVTGPVAAAVLKVACAN